MILSVGRRLLGSPTFVCKCVCIRECVRVYVLNVSYFNAISLTIA